MYLGIDFLISPDQQPYVVEVNVGLPGGAQEYHLTQLVRFGRHSDIFSRIEETSKRVYGKTFQDYLHSLPWIQSLKPFKIWMDGQGSFPQNLHPGLRLEDKWVQYQLLNPTIPMPETVVLDPENQESAEQFLKRKGKLVVKRRLGRGGKGFRVLESSSALSSLRSEGLPCLLQEFIESRVERFTFSVRSVAFAGEFMCMYANLSPKSTSNHGLLTFVSQGNPFGLSEKDFKTESFNQKSWEAEIWFGENEPSYLRHNLYEDEVAKAALVLPEPYYRMIKELSVKIERLYEGIDLSSLPKACFEE